MRAICFAILALVVYLMGQTIANAGNVDGIKGKTFVGGCFLLVAVLLVIAAFVLCIAGL